MKKLNSSSLFFFAGILWLLVGIISEDMSWGYALGIAFITLGIAMRIKDSFTEDSEEGELLTDEEEKQVWEEFQSKVEDEDDDIS
tara:strand:+ start:131 stop:385 length:255 start_codon:yes stop_codon:yes gene_type:complete